VSTAAGTLDRMAAVVLQGPANTAPERIIGPFATMGEATSWAQNRPRPGGYSVAQDLTPPDHQPGDA
jgi:hypothetical protein